MRKEWFRQGLLGKGSGIAGGKAGTRPVPTHALYPFPLLQMPARKGKWGHGSRAPGSSGWVVTWPIIQKVLLLELTVS